MSSERYVTEHSMKALMRVAIMEAVRIAVTDCGWPDEVRNKIDVTALGQNVSNRLLGSGGWKIDGRYAPNLSPAQVMELSIPDSSRDPNQDIKDIIHGGEK